MDDTVTFDVEALIDDVVEGVDKEIEELEREVDSIQAQIDDLSLEQSALEDQITAAHNRRRSIEIVARKTMRGESVAVDIEVTPEMAHIAAAAPKHASWDDLRAVNMRYQEAALSSGRNQAIAIVEQRLS